MEEVIQRFMAYMNHEKEVCLMEEKRLRADERIDEANFEKVKWNVYDIFSILLNSAKQKATDVEQLKSAYLPRFDTIPMNWRTRLATAKQHDDAETIYIEETKLGIANQIKEMFLELVNG